MKYPRRKEKRFTSNTAYQKALRQWRVWNKQRIQNTFPTEDMRAYRFAVKSGFTTGLIFSPVAVRPELVSPRPKGV